MEEGSNSLCNLKIIFMIYSYSKTVRQGLLTLAALRHFGVPFMDPELPGGLAGSRKVMNRGWVRLSSQPIHLQTVCHFNKAL